MIYRNLKERNVIKKSEQSVCACFSVYSSLTTSEQPIQTMRIVFFARIVKELQFGTMELGVGKIQSSVPCAITMSNR